ncbi:mCG116599 [Mus musculus]|nr:mCG116599 [Mus musculus]
MFLWGFRQLEKSGGEKQGSGGTAETVLEIEATLPPAREASFYHLLCLYKCPSVHFTDKESAGSRI